MKKRDVLILGGGAAGLIMAFSLAERGVSFALLEEREKPALATSAKGCAIVNLFPMDNPVRLERTVGSQAAEELLLFYRSNLLQTVDLLKATETLYQKGLWVCPASSTEKEELQETAERLSDETVWKQPSPLPSQPQGLFVQDALFFDASLFLEKVAGAVAPHLFLGERVLSVQKREDVQVKTVRGEWKSEVAIVCLNAYIPKLFPEWDKMIYPLRAQSFLASSPSLSSPLLYNFGHEIDFPEKGKIWVGGIHPYATFADLTYEETPTATFQKFMEHSFQKRWGRAPEVQARSAGIIAATPTGFPLIGRLPGRVDLLLLAGFNARGWCAIPAGAFALADLITKGKAFLPSLFSPARSLSC